MILASSELRRCKHYYIATVDSIIRGVTLVALVALVAFEAAGNFLYALLFVRCFWQKKVARVRDGVAPSK